MTIKDINGNTITIEDLDLAIMQADDYRHYRHTSIQYAGVDERQRRYWEDVYQKLLQLKKD
ncbi:MAG TPA: hypothetical protein VHA52_06960 [Candidatus Babeliaceae bacterium]|nr:hypothetical protein [Candidatus Babeliaceae bacterium]